MYWIAEIGAGLARSMTSPAFELTAHSIGVFPKHGGLSMLWVGLGDGVDVLIALEE